MSEEAQASRVVVATTPFWGRIGKLALLPLGRDALGLNLLAAAPLALLAAWGIPALRLLPVGQVALTLAAWFALALPLSRHGALIIERSSAGFLHPSTWPRHLGGGSWSRAARLSAAAIAIPLSLVYFAGTFLPSALTFTVLLALAVVVPGSMIVMTQTDSLGAALNPRRALELQLQHRIGLEYFGLAPFAAVALVVGRQGIRAALPDFSVLPPGMEPTSAGVVAATAFAGAVAVHYAFQALCATVGYAMFQYSHGLGVAVLGPGEAAEARSDSAARYERRAREALIARHIEEGEIPEAIEVVNEELRKRPRDISQHKRLHELLLLEGSHPRIESHTIRFLTVLLQAGSTREALALLRTVKERIPTFEVPEPEQRIELARAALENAEFELATGLIRGFDRRFQNHPLVPQAYVLAARLLLHAGRDDEARQMLEHVIKATTAGPTFVEAKGYLKRFERGAGRSS